MTAARVLALAGLAGVAIVAGLVLTGGDGRYLVRLEMDNAGGLRKGANVRVGGAPAGEVKQIRLDENDRAVAELRLEPGVAPIGRGARATVDTDGLFGERFVEIDRGDVRRPEPSGGVIPAARASVSVRLDDVIDALDVDTRQALRAFLNEQGAAIAGRGNDLAATLEALPSGLDRTGTLLAELAAEDRALARLVESSDRVVGQVAAERRELGRLLGGFGATLDTLDSRRRELGETVRLAPATLRAARRALVALNAAAAPLIPAARGLRETAGPLTGVLAELPGFADDAEPALQTARRVAGDLQRLATRATPAVRDLRPVAAELSTYTRRGFGPFTELLDRGAADVFGVMEGWARSTQGRDAASHIFRFGASSGSDAFAALVAPPPARRQPRRTPRAPAGGAAPALPRVPDLGELPPLPKVPKLPKLPKVPRVPQLPSGSAVDAVPTDPDPARTGALLDLLRGP